MTAIKMWFLEKNDLMGIYGRELQVVKETEKAVMVSYWIHSIHYTTWIPKSCIIDKWEKDTTNFGYHEYLAVTLQEAFPNQVYAHQYKTKELIEMLERKNIKFMNRKEWNNRPGA